MNRQQKEVVISELKDMFNRSNASFLVEYKGIGVAPLQSLRKKLRNDNAVFKVAKARLMKKAGAQLAANDNFKNQFKNQVGLIFAFKEVPCVAKDIVEFSKENEAMKVISGVFESKLMSKDQITWLASIPSREVLLAQLVGMLQAPVAQLLHCLEVIKERKAAPAEAGSEQQKAAE